MFKFSKHGLNLSLDLIVVQFYLNDTKILPSEFVTCFWLTATLTVYGREIFIYTDLTLLRMENVQFNIFKPKTLKQVIK